MIQLFTFICDVDSFESVHGIMSQTNSNALYSTESLKASPYAMQNLKDYFSVLCLTESSFNYATLIKCINFLA